MPEKTPSVICDLDGTLYDSKARTKKFLSDGKKDFDGFYENAYRDEPHHWCAELVKAMAVKGFRILFVSGRPDNFSFTTQQWIKKHLGWSPDQYELFMRPRGDYTPDSELKNLIWRRDIFPKYEVLFAVDDRKRIVEMWRFLGIPCLQCAEGNF